MTPPVWQKAKKNQRASDESKIGEWKSWPKSKIMVSGPSTSWQINGETMEKVRDFILGGSKPLHMVTAAMQLKDACSLEEKL